MIRLHLIANALLLWLGYYWLGVGESSIPRLLWSAVVALVLIACAVLIHGAALAEPQSGQPIQTVRGTARHLLPLLILAIVVVVLYGALTWWRGYSETPALNIASWLTLKTRKPVKPESVLGVFNFFLWVVRWVALPWVFVPMAASLAKGGWAGVGKATWKRSKVYWVLVPMLLVIAIWVPLKLIGWVPHFSSFAVQVFSFSIRAMIAYALFVGGLMGLARATSSTAVAPDPLPPPPAIPA